MFIVCLCAYLCVCYVWGVAVWVGGYVSVGVSHTLGLDQRQ